MKYKQMTLLVPGTIAVGLGLLALGVFRPTHVKALSGFDPSSVFSDAIMLNASTMDIPSIQSFLNSRVHTCSVTICLKNFSEGGKSAATIIADAANSYGVNPRILLAILEAQQMLVTNTSPTQSSFDNAMSFTQVTGFTNQINRAAQDLADWTRGPANGAFASGVRYDIPYSPNAACGTASVTPVTRATAALYSLPQLGYIPNPAALDANASQGDACSEYGVRNVYTNYNVWFGTLRLEPTTPVYRFWSPKNQHHFYTATAQEVSVIQASYTSNVWTYEGGRFNVPIDPGCTNSAPVYRFWSPKNQTHFYTISAQEKDVIVATYPTNVWQYEGIAYCAYPTQVDGSTALYRFWSPQNQGHFFTSSVQEKDVIIATYPSTTWTYEGVAYYVK